MLFGILSSATYNPCSSISMWYFSSFFSILTFSSTNSNSSLLSFVYCNFNVSMCVHDCTFCKTLTFSLYNALVGIWVITNWIWAKYFNGVWPTISSMHNMLGVMWNVELDCVVFWILSYSLDPTSAPICGADGIVSMPLMALCFSLSCWRSCLMSSNFLWIPSLCCWASSKSPIVWS